MVYDQKESLTGSPGNQPTNKLTFYLLACCIAACLASLQFGYNIGVTNLPTQHIQRYYLKTSSESDYLKVTNSSDLEPAEKNLTLEFKIYQDREFARASKIQELNLFKNTTSLALNDEQYNATVDKFKAEIGDLTKLANEEDQLLSNRTLELRRSQEARKKEIADINGFNDMLWTITNCLFVLGGMIGAICSKVISDSFGRRNSIVIHNIFSVIGALLALMSEPINHYSAIKLSRFLYGVQGGMACSLVPSYLNEISPSNLRGVTGVINQLCITLGILISQILGFRQLLGTSTLWTYLLGLPIVPAIIGSACLLFLFPKTPHELLKANDEDGAKDALKKLRNRSKVTDELEQIKSEVNQNSGVAALSILQVFRESRLRWPIVSGMIVHLSQQLCGINAIFFYSGGIFKDSGVTGDEIQYAVMLTGLINVVSTLVAVPMIERLGRKPLLVLPMMIMIVDFIALTVCLKLAETSRCFSYLGIVGILLFIVCFAVGLGPIPFLFVAECFEPHTKSAAMAICIFVNWASNLLLVLVFPFLQSVLGPFVFLIFAGIVALSVTYIAKKVPETKDKTVEQIITKFNSGKFYYAQPSTSNINMKNMSSNNNERI